MAITVSCSCGASFKAKDHLAGKRVKCPKCQGVIDIPAAKPVISQNVPPASSGQSANPLLDLLDEAGVKSVQTGPTCPACAEAMAPTAVICVNCGYNVATGEYLDTYVEMEETQMNEKGELTDAQKIMEKAERSIDESPETAAGQDFGDGADAWVIAAGALAIFAALVCIGVVIVLTMESVADTTGVVFLTIIGFMFILNLARIWIIVVAFFEGVEHGITCLFFDVYTVYYGFTRGLKWQSYVLIAGWVGTIIIYSIRGYLEGGDSGTDDASAMIFQFFVG